MQPTFLGEFGSDVTLPTTDACAFCASWTSIPLNLYCTSWPRWLHTSWNQSRVHSVHHKKPPPAQLGSVEEESGFLVDKKQDIAPLWRICIKFNAMKHHFWGGELPVKKPEVFTVWVMLSLTVVYCRVWGIFWKCFMVTFCDVFRRGRKGRRGQ